jgi:hypothetical protein
LIAEAAVLYICDMNYARYTSDLGSSLGFSYLQEWVFKPRTVYKSGGIFGIYSGYLIGMGILVPGGDDATCLHIIVRHTPVGAPASQQIQSALKSLLGFRGFVSRLSAKTAENRVEIFWPLGGFKAKPTAQEITNLLDLALKEIRCHARPLDDKCEDCRMATASQIVLLDGIPGRHCGSCQRAMMARIEAQAAEYDTKKVDYTKGLQIGTCLAVAMGAFWGMVQYASRTWDGNGATHILGFASLTTAGLIFWGLFRTLGKKERRGVILAAFLTLTSRLGAVLLSWSDLLIHGQPIPDSWLAYGVAGFALDLILVLVLSLVPLPWTRARPIILLQPITVGGQDLPAVPGRTGKPLVFG